MSGTHTDRPVARARGFCAVDLFWWLVILAMLLAILLPSLARAREVAKRAVCASNLRGIGQAMHVYANENREWFPAHPFDAVTLDPFEKREADEPLNAPAEHGVRWVGAMGSNEFLKISEPSTRSPKYNHPSRALFLLIIDGSTTGKSYICPSSSDSEDDFRNRGPDRGLSGEQAAQFAEVACQPGVTRFDFRGYKHLSYGYQLPYGPKSRPTELLDTRVAVAADKGPYYEAGGPGLAGSETVRDQRSATNPPAGAADAAALLKQEANFWRPYNSRNHGREGENVLFVDGHVEFVKKPIVGVNYDNIYTLQSEHTLAGSLRGMVPGAEQAYGPFTQTDSFIVP